MAERIKNLFRAIEIAFAVIFMLWAFPKLPSAVEFARRLFAVVLSHPFVFLLGNLIALVLFYESRSLQGAAAAAAAEEEEAVTEVAGSGFEDDGRRRMGAAAEMNGDELRRASEEFIEKQVVFHKRENMGF
ncbi:hypothetical protein M569_10803 [Genlisea aurea]|uniref:DUF4408 domain-containing protein n=1 Tax=Genlisea aurea TaxID=192259 RepID=S8DVP7_9LAMI|nr:hypothetical protein M569_10803 [Genlisea aurea]